MKMLSKPVTMQDQSSEENVFTRGDYPGSSSFQKKGTLNSVKAPEELGKGRLKTDTEFDHQEPAGIQCCEEAGKPALG